MNISLTEELQRFIQQKVQSGLYGSASEVIRDCVRRARAEDAQLAELRREIDLGLQDIEEGRVVSGEEVFKDLRKKVSRGTSQKRKK